MSGQKYRNSEIGERIDRKDREQVEIRKTREGVKRDKERSR